MRVGLGGAEGLAADARASHGCRASGGIHAIHTFCNVIFVTGRQGEQKSDRVRYTIVTKVTIVPVISIEKFLPFLNICVREPLR